MILQVLQLSLKSPKAAIRTVLNWRLSLGESALALTLMAVLSAGLMSLVVGPLPAGIDPVSAAMLTNPVYLAAVQLVGLAMISLFLFLLGRVAGGRGTLPEAVAMMAWLEGVLILISVVQVVALVLLPPLGLVLLLAGMGLSLWLVTNFVAELHGFPSLLLTLLGVIAAFVGAVIAMILVFLLLFALGVLHV
ncbi:MAG: YIP1 family protein [Pseudorhodobacter sp.]|nr:YIP1 family protein [Pseudorhodobacter sp.]